MGVGLALGFLIGIISGTVFGGPWLTTKLLEPVQVQDLINPYVGSLAVTFSIISLYPAARWIIQLGEDFGKRRGE